MLSRKSIPIIGRSAEVLLGIVFATSALSKALYVNLFVIQITYYHVISAPTLLDIAALGTLWIETALCVALLGGLRLRGLTYAVVFAMLAVFSALIVYGWVFHDLEDCGCFGPIEMSPEVSLLKNLAFAILAFVAWWLTRSRPRRGWKHFVPMALACVAAATGVAGYSYAHLEEAVESGEESHPFAQFVFELDGTTWDLGVGEYYVVMLSMTCEHCMETVEILNEEALSPDFPEVVALCFHETDEELQEFIDITAPIFPMFSLGDRVRTFFTMVNSELGPPRFYYVRDGQAVTYWDYISPDASEVFAAREAYDSGEG